MTSQAVSAVLDWAGYDDPLYWQDFKDAYPNVNVGFEFGDLDGTIYGLMKGGDQADVFHPYTGWIQFYADEGLAAEIDTSKLTNWDKVPDQLKKMGEVNGKQYYVPYDWGFTSILYNTEKITTPIDSWSALMDPQYKGHISMWNDGPGAVTISSYIHGYDETNVTDEQLAAHQAGVDRPDETQPALLGGRARAPAAMAERRCLGGLRMAGLLCHAPRQGVPVAYANPKEGTQLVGRLLWYPQGRRRLRPGAQVPGREAR